MTRRGSVPHRRPADSRSTRVFHLTQKAIRQGRGPPFIQAANSAAHEAWPQLLALMAGTQLARPLQETCIMLVLNELYEQHKHDQNPLKPNKTPLKN